MKQTEGTISLNGKDKFSEDGQERLRQLAYLNNMYPNLSQSEVEEFKTLLKYAFANTDFLKLFIKNLVTEIEITQEVSANWLNESVDGRSQSQFNQIQTDPQRGPK